MLDHLKDMQPLADRLGRMGDLFNPFQTSLDSIFQKLETMDDDNSKEALQNMKKYDYDI